MDGGDPGDDVAAELLAAFERSSSGIAQQLAALAARDDHRGMAGAAHQLVSSSGWIGATRLSALARDLESAAREGRRDDAQGLLDDALVELARVHAAIATIASGGRP